MQIGRRIALLLAAALVWMALPSGTAMADSLKVTAGRLNIRAEASAESEAIAVVKEGEELEFIAKSGDWRKVRYNGKTGYVLKDYVVSVKEDDGVRVTDFSSEGRANARVNLRALPDVESDVLTVIGQGGGLKITGKAGKWYRASYGGQTGYLMAQYVSLGEQEAPSGSDHPAGGQTGIALARVNVRKSPSTNADVVRVVGEGEQVSVTGKSGDWYAVTSGGRKGYILAELLRVEEGGKSEPSAGEAAAQGTVNARVNLRSAADTGSRVIAVLDAGEKISVIGRSGSFYQALYRGKVGYITRDCVKTSASFPGDDIYPAAVGGQTTVAVNLRGAPGGMILRTLPERASILLLGESDNWYKVAYEGEIGYVSGEYVTERQETGGESGQPGTGETAYVAANSLNLRKGPGESYGIVRVLRLGEKIECFEKKDGWYRVKAGGEEGYVSARYVSREQPDPSQSVGKVILSDWYRGEVSDVFDRGDTAIITDVRTGVCFRARRTGGFNHADAQPLTEEDTKILYKIYGYQWQWTRRPVWVTVDGKTYAGSMNGMPHGETDPMPDNDFDGCFCIHFLNSKTHGTSRVDGAHQDCVSEAYEAARS